MGVGNNIRKFRKEKLLTQKELSKLSGVHEVQIARYELGSLNPKLETLKKIAAALEVPYTDLLNDDVESKEESYRLTQEACMQLALKDFNIKVSSTMADAIMNEFFRLMVLHGYLKKED